MSFSQRCEERAGTFSSLVQHHFKAELYRYVYIVIFGKNLSKCYWIVSQEDLQHKILNWSTLLPSCPYI